MQLWIPLALNLPHGQHHGRQITNRNLQRGREGVGCKAILPTSSWWSPEPPSLTLLRLPPTGAHGCSWCVSASQLRPLRKHTITAAAGPALQPTSFHGSICPRGASP